MCSYKYFSPWRLWPKPYAWHLEKRVSLKFILRTLSLWNIHIIIGYIRGFNGPMPLIWMLRLEGTCIILSNVCSIREDVFWSKWSRLCSSYNGNESLLRANTLNFFAPNFYELSYVPLNSIRVRLPQLLHKYLLSKTIKATFRLSDLI